MKGKNMSINILRIDASARREGSVSRGLTERITGRLAAAHTGATITTRDLSEPLPQITESWIAVNFTPPAERSPEQAALLALSDKLVAELQAADMVVIGLPVYNFSVPAALKAWIDLITRVGLTFRYTETGPEGLLEGKRVIVAMASGGTKPGSEADFATTYLRHILAFNGLTEVEIIAADALAGDPEGSIAAANAQIERLAA